MFTHWLFARRRATTADLYSTPDALDRASQLSPAALRLHAAIAMETIAAVAYGPARARLAAQLALADDQVDEVQLNDNVVRVFVACVLFPPLSCRNRV